MLCAGCDIYFPVLSGFVGTNMKWTDISLKASCDHLLLFVQRTAHVLQGFSHPIYNFSKCYAPLKRSFLFSNTRCFFQYFCKNTNTVSFNSLKVSNWYDHLYSLIVTWPLLGKLFRHFFSPQGRYLKLFFGRLLLFFPLLCKMIAHCLSNVEVQGY